MKWILCALAFASLPALAHVEPGVYKGTTSDGRECSMTAGKAYFDHDKAHPLNERVPVSVGDDSFVLGHPDYYPRFGYSTETAHPFASPFAGPHFMALLLDKSVRLPESGRARYAPAFGPER